MSVKAGETRIGWVGTGVMGLHMARHVIQNGYTPLTVYNRTQSKAQPLVDLGAKHAKSLKEVAENSDVIFTMVGYPSDVESIITSPTGLLTNLKKGGIIIDMTTSSPKLAEQLSELASKQGKHILDAPVSGGDIGAKNGALSVMIGGNKDTVNHIHPILESFSKVITYLGNAGAGQHCKMGNQITIATNMIGVCEGLLYAQSAGLNVEQYLSAIAGGAAGSFSVSKLAPRILTGDLGPGFYVEHFVKDLGIALDSCKQMNLALPGLALAHQLYVSLTACGHSKLGIHGLIKVLERLNDTKLETQEYFSAW